MSWDAVEVQRLHQLEVEEEIKMQDPRDVNRKKTSPSKGDPTALHLMEGGTPPPSRGRRTAGASSSTAHQTDEMVTAAGLTTEEMAIITKRREKQAASKAKVKETKALTGIRADYPSLSNAWSEDPVINVMCSVQSRLRTFIWKKFVWLLRVRNAIHIESKGKAAWRRNHRWLAMLFSKEIAALWGHFGAMRQKMVRDPQLRM